MKEKFRILNFLEDQDSFWVWAFWIEVGLFFLIIALLLT